MSSSSFESARLELELSPDPSCVGEARRAVTGLAHRVGAPVEDVKLVVSEAVGNAVTHAFRGREGGTITVRARVQDALLIIDVADDGIGMSPNLDSPGLGFGVALMTKLAHEVRFDSSDKGTTVSMTFATDGR